MLSFIKSSVAVAAMLFVISACSKSNDVQPISKSVVDSVKHDVIPAYLLMPAKARHKTLKVLYVDSLSNSYQYSPNFINDVRIGDTLRFVDRSFYITSFNDTNQVPDFEGFRSVSGGKFDVPVRSFDYIVSAAHSLNLPVKGGFYSSAVSGDIGDYLQVTTHHSHFPGYTISEYLITW